MLKVKLLTGAAAWISAVVLGFGGLARYETRPGCEAIAPRLWPAQSRLHRASDCPTLLLFLHPHCPCSRASLQELEEVLRNHADDMRTHVVFCRPDGVAEGWERTELWQRAVSLRTVQLHADDYDRERRLFGAKTSGQVMLFDNNGDLRYSGGITLARGQVGAGPGRAAVVALVRGEAPPSTHGLVFGCPLEDPDQPFCKDGSPCPK